MVLHPVNIRFGNIIFTLAIRSSLYTYKSTTCHPKCQSTFIFNIVFSFYILFLRTVSIKGLLEMIKTVIITLMVLIIFSINWFIILATGHHTNRVDYYHHRKGNTIHLYWIPYQAACILVGTESIPIWNWTK